MKNIPDMSEAVIQERERAEKRRQIENETHRISTVHKLPTTAQYFAIEQSTVTYDSGYGDRGQADMCSQDILNLTWFDTEQALEAWVLKAAEQQKSYRIVHVEPVKTEVKAVFSIQK